jgi:hypothetical protein
MKIRRIEFGRLNLLFAVAMLTCLAPGRSSANELSDVDKTKICTEMATLFRAARAIISENQQLIDDPAKGDKGLSGAVVVGKTREKYQQMAGEPLADDATGSKLATEARTAMLASIDEVMEANQDWINEQGKGFKGFLPAVFAKMLADRFTKKMSGRMAVKLTAPKYLVRNRGNRPDEWETKVMDTKFTADTYPRGQAFAERAAHKKGDAWRLMVPEYYGQSCLKCHGDPKGQRDITGGLMEGGQLDQLGGAISVALFE